MLAGKKGNLNALTMLCAAQLLYPRKERKTNEGNKSIRQKRKVVAIPPGEFGEKKRGGGEARGLYTNLE